MTFGGFGDDAVRRIQHRLSAAVILFQDDRCRAWKLLGKVQNVAHRRCPERVDGLGVVADNGHSVAIRTQIPKNLGL